MIELPKEIAETNKDNHNWSLFVDGSSSQQEAGIGIRLSSPTGETLEQAFRLNFKPTNNEAEYEALLTGLRLAKAIGVKHIKARCDSQLLASQFSGYYEAKDEPMHKYLKLVRQLSKDFTTFELLKISRAEKKSADALVALATALDPIYSRTVPIEAINKPSIDLDGTVHVLIDEDLPEEDETEQPTSPPNATSNWRTEIQLYTILHGRLHRWSSSGALLTSISGDKTLRVITKTHEGTRGNHSGCRALALKIRKHGYFWPSMIEDCEKIAVQCEKCQRHAPLINAPTELLTIGLAPYPFIARSTEKCLLFYQLSHNNKSF